jgi:hypothetical protein
MTQALLLAMPDSDIAPVTEDAAIEQPPDEAAQNRREKQAELNKRFKIAELLFLLKVTELGYEVKWMQGNCKDYDVILERTGMRPIFVQVKYSVWKTSNKCYNIYNCTSGRNKAYSATAYDVLAVYLWDRNEWVLYTRDELGNRIGTSYTPPELRRAAVRSNAPDARDPNNWHLLDEVAESLTAHQKSFTPKTADVLPPLVQMFT